MVVNIGTRMIYPFLPTFARAFGVGIADISLAVTARSATGFLSPFLGLLVDRWGRKKGILVSIGAFVLSNALVIIWPVYPVFFASLSFTFLVYYMYLSAMHAYLGDNVPYEQRGKAMGLTEIGWAAAFILGMPVVGFLISRFGWVAPFPLLVSMGILVFAVLYWLLPDAEETQSTLETSKSRNGGLRLVFTSPSALAGLAVSMLALSANESINLVFGVWLEDSFGLKLAALGAASAVIGFSDLTGELAGGGLVDRLGKERSMAVGLVLNGVFAAALPWLSGFGVGGALVGLFFFYMSFEFTAVSGFSIMSEILPQARATLLGANVAALSLGRMFGALLAPLVYQLGFQYNGLASLILNLLAVAALSKVRIGMKDGG